MLHILIEVAIVLLLCAGIWVAVRRVRRAWNPAGVEPRIDRCSMVRPKGVTVLACLYLFIAFAMLIALIPSQGFDPSQHPVFVAQSAMYLIVGVTLGIALLRMRKWSRLLSITLSAAQLLTALFVIARPEFATGRLTLPRTLLAMWAIYYLTRPHIKVSFQRA